MIDELLPPAIASAESLIDAPSSQLLPEELRLLENAAEKRRREFTTGRVCARRALAQLGIEPVPILIGGNREPLWPVGVVGSLTHCTGFRAAAVGRAQEYRSIGIDAEPDEALPDGVLEQVSLPSERAQLALGAPPHMDRLLFSAKECVYKTWFPVAQRWLGFLDAEIALHVDGSFDAQLLVAGPIRSFRGRWLAREGLIITAIAAPFGAGV